MRKFPDDHDYIFQIIDYLFENHGINFFITSKDFDVLYNWWEKKIPEDLIRKSIDNIHKKRKLKGKKIDSFMNFSYEVKKNLAYKFDLDVNQENVITINRPGERSKEFFEDFPEGLKEFENEFRKLKDLSEKKRAMLLDEIYEMIIKKNNNDEEMNIKTEIFMSNLPAAMRKPEIVRKFKINYLNRRYNIPDFE